MNAARAVIILMGLNAGMFGLLLGLSIPPVVQAAVHAQACRS